MGITTLDDELAEAFEPHAAPPSLRLAQAAQLVRAGIRTQVRLDPILPGLTDDEATIDALCASLAGIGVKHIAASALFLRPGITRALTQRLSDRTMLETLLGHFRRAERLGIRARGSSVLALPIAARRAIYGRVERIAHHHGRVVRLCACKNPDLATGSCSIAADWTVEPAKQVQLSLFAERGRR